MILIKIGGGSSININGIIQDLADLNEKFIIIHGANAVRDQLSISLNKPKKILTSIKGYSSVYSDTDAIELIFMAYSGLLNKQIVEICQLKGINAIGLTGIDGQLIRGKRNKGIRVIENGKKKIKRDLSGKPQSINIDLLTLLLNNGYTPVITVPIIDEFNTAINSENDDIVALFQEVFNLDSIIFLIEAPGLMENPEMEESIYSHLSISDIERLESESEGRIKRKYHALRRISNIGNKKIIISDGRVPNPIKNALQGHGTRITQN